MRSKLLAMCAISLMLEGCVGAGPVVTKVSAKKIDSSLNSPTSVCPTSETGTFSLCSQVPSLEDFQKAWGEPASKNDRSGATVAKYKTDIAWRGFVIFAIIPIPLLAPVGRNEISLTFQNNKLIGIDREFGEGNYAICGLHSEGPNGFGCTIWH